MSAPVDNPLNRPTRSVPRPMRRLALVADHDPLVVRGTFIEKDADALGVARAPLAAAKEFRTTVNQLVDTTSNRAELAKATTARMGSVTKMFDVAVPALTAKRNGIEKQINAVLTGPPDSHALAICAHWSKANYSDLVNRVEDGDLRTTSAVLAAPAYLSGMTDEQQSQLRAHARRKFAPELDGMSQDLDQAITTIKRVGERLVMEVAGCVNEWGSSDRDADVINRKLGVS